MPCMALTGRADNMTTIGIALILILILISIARVTYVLLNIYRARKLPFANSSKCDYVKTLIVAGSGGHTTEILTLVRSLGNAYTPRHYIIADTDHMSKTKIEKLEKTKSPSSINENRLSFIPRSREVAQSWISSVWTTIIASLRCFPLVFLDPPDLILVNGPGTCIPVCVAGLLLRISGIRLVRIVYVESICRVETLSLSGKILYFFADQFLVQWPQLKEKYPLAHYIGRVV